MPSTMLQRLNKWRWLAFLLVAAGTVAAYVALAGGNFPLDDSWIHQTYGRNLGTRGEWSLVPGQPSAASTAPLYTVLLAAGYAVGAPFRLWTHALGVVALWGVGVFGARLADRAAPGVRYAGLFVGLLLVTAWHLLWAAGSGMETALFALWTVLLPLLAWLEVDESRRRAFVLSLGRGALFGAASALAVLTRPEGIVIAGLAGLAFLVVVWRGEIAVRAAVTWIGGAALGFAVCIAPYLWLNLHLTGGLLPTTSAAKQTQHAPLLALSYPRRVWMMTVPPFVGGQVLLLPGMVWYAVVCVRARRAFALVPLVWALALILLYAARLPAAYQHGRYVIPAIPSLVLAGGVGTLWLLRAGRRSMVGRVFSRALVAAAGLVFAVMAFVVAPGVYVRDVAVINEEMVAAAQWLDANVPPDDLLAVHDIGAVAYFTPRPMIDIAGLVSPEIIPIVNDADALWSLMEGRGADYLMAFPDQIPGDSPDDPRLCEVFSTGGAAALDAGGANMAVYRLAWDGDCTPFIANN